ncbi:MAG TPA: TraB/GumN family protein [Arenicellales bacterium]|nr:TraB/GumN family protein [Arenicellales bacterium]
MSGRRPRRPFTALLALALPAAGLADAAVWRVTGGPSPFYVAGTIHKLSPDHYPLPEEYQAAYQRSEVLVFETDIAAMQSTDVRSQLAARSRLPDGETLTGLLQPETRRALADYCADTDFPVERLERLRPAPAMLTLLAVALNDLGVTAPGVDEYFHRRARADAKATLALETPEQQIDYLLSLDQGDPNGFVMRSIADLREARRGGLETSLDIWRQGDEEKLVEHFLKDPLLEAPELYQALLVERNRNWMTSIRQFAETAEIELVLVGVAHLLGEHGLPALLAAEGYAVEKLDLSR